MRRDGYSIATMGVEMLLLFGLGVTGVVISNLLTGEEAEVRIEAGGTSRGTATLPSSRTEPADGASEAEPRAPKSPEREATDGELAGDVRAVVREVGIDVADDRPKIWGHPAPLARALALITVGGLVLGSSIWIAGWLLVQAVTRSLGGG